MYLCIQLATKIPRKTKKQILLIVFRTCRRWPYTFVVIDLYIHKTIIVANIGRYYKMGRTKMHKTAVCALADFNFSR